MFEDRTFENILSEMLERVPSDVDKREGSVIYDALAPSAYALADQYFKLRNFLDLLFADTSIGEYLDLCVSDIGMDRNPATYAVRKVETSGTIDIGSIWSIESITYTITGLIEENTYEATCNTAGEIGNTYSGELSMVSGNSNVTANLTDIITVGVNEESDEALRSRYYQQVRLQPSSGNRANYLVWAKEVPGVGDAKVFGLWNGNGTVKVLIVNTDYGIEESLEEQVYEHIEEERPIGPTITVDSPMAKPISVTSAIIKNSSRTIEEIKADFTASLQEYFKSVIATYYNKLLDTGSYRVSFGMIGNILFDTEGVEDYESLSINGDISNITINSTEIPTIGEIVLTESEVQNELNDAPTT